MVNDGNTFTTAFFFGGAWQILKRASTTINHQKKDKGGNNL
jgi:hypothetical protein